MANADLSIKIGADIGDAVVGIEKFKNALGDLATGSIAQLTRAAALLKTQLANLTPTQLNSNIGQGLTNALAEVNDQLKALKTNANLAKPPIDELERRIVHSGTATHDFARVVGGLPGILSGASGGTQVLSGELFVLGTGIARAKESGESFGSIFASLGKSLFSVGGAITIVALAIPELIKLIKESGNTFDQASLKAEVFADRIDSIGKAADQLKQRLDFEQSIKSLDFKVKFGEGIKSNLNDLNLTFDKNKTLLENNDAVIIRLIKDLKELNKNKPDFSVSTTSRISQGEGLPLKTVSAITPIGELVRAGKLTQVGGDLIGLEKLTDEELKKLSKSWQNYVNDYKKIQEALGKANERSRLIGQDNLTSQKETDLKLADSGREAAEKRLKELKKQNEEEAKLRKQKLKDIVKDFQEQTLIELQGGQPFISPKFITEVDLSDFDKIGQKVTELRANIFKLQDVNKNVSGTDLGEQINKLKERLDVLTKLQKVIHDTSDDKKVEDFFKRVQERATKTADIISNSIGSAIGSMVDAFKSGQDPIKSFFQSIGNDIIHFVGQLITAAIKAFILKKILSIAFPGLGNLIGNGLSIGGLAEGGPISSGKATLVGEKGPELFVPSTSGRIIPNSNLSSIRGGALQSQVIIPDVFVRGRDLQLVFERQNGFNRRNV